ncbi:glycosyltransferase, partial [Galbibacter sp.]|uniref:glycosyltransferase n=1 Tax=Galbibacter sp. TaxID=2918471 RepID=UPI002C7FC859
EDVIRIFHGIQKVMPARLIMVGEGPEKEPAEDLCQELGIADKVAFLGNSNEVDKILCYSDLFLLPSETESFGLAALEAMVNEVPVISSNAGGIPEVNKHGISGFLSPIGAVDEMISNALHILSDDQRLEMFKQQARNQASIFDINYVVPLYEEIYEIAYNKLIKGQL